MARLSVLTIYTLACISSVTSAYLPVRSCTVKCPLADRGGVAVGEQNTTDGVTFCSYPISPGEDPLDHYCTYSSVSIGSEIRPRTDAPQTGSLILDHDTGP